MRRSASIDVEEAEPAIAPRPLYPDAIIEAKLAPPSLRADVLPREAVIERLLGVTGQQLVTLLAPPGYGKTTSLALWRAREGRPVAWLTADAADADPTRFLLHMAVAIERATGLELASAGLLAGAGTSALSTAVPRLTSTLHRAGQPLVVMVDDVHHLAASPTIDVLAMFIDYAPDGMAVAVAGRSDPGLPLARFRAGGRMLEVTTRDLALDEAEAARLANLGGHDLQPDEARELHARTEGWPAAVYLATRRPTRAAHDGAARATSVSGRDTDVGDYLDAELLHETTPRVRAFLIKTSILDRMSADLCDAVVHGAGSDRTLRGLAASNQLVVSLDTEGGWYRYHTLLREHLLGKLERDPAAAGAARRRAARWYAAHGMVDHAIDHLFAAGDLDGAAALATASGLGMVRDGREATLLRWIAQFDEATLRRHPYLAAAASWVHTIKGQAAEAERMIDLADGATYDAGRPIGAESFETAAASVRALHARRGLEAALADAEHAVAIETRLSGWRPPAMAVLGVALAVSGDPERADAILDEAARTARVLSAGRAEIFAESWRALLAIERDDWPTATRMSREGLVSMAHYRYETDATVSAGYVAAARVALHRGEIAEARRQMATFQMARAAIGPATAWIGVRLLIDAARAYLALADPAGARSCLQQASDILVRRPGLGDLPRQVATLRDRIRSLPPGPGGTSTLTPAEVRVLRLLPTYLTAAEMAERLFVTPNTVRTQIQALYGKLGASSRAEAVELAIEAGLLEPLPVLAPGGITTI